MGMRQVQLGAALALLGLAACSKPFDYDSASESERQAFFESAAQGIYDGLDQSIPHGKGGVYMQMGKRKIDVAHRRIEIQVDVQNGEDDEEDMPDFSGLTSAKLLRGVCPEYLAGDLARNDVTVYIRFALPGGGTAAAVSATPGACASYGRKN